MFSNGLLYEGTGLNGKSRVLAVDASTGKEVATTDVLDAAHFGEGIALVPPRAGSSANGGEELLVQLTYKLGKGFVYRKKDLSLVREFDFATYTGQGWGLAYDAHRHELVVI